MSVETPFEELYKTSGTKVYRYLLSLAGDKALAEELTAETFYRAYLHIDRFRGASSVDTWLFAIAKNVWLTEERRRRRLTQPVEEAEAAPSWEALEDHDTALRIHKLLHRLPEPYREVFTLRVFGELRFRDIAEIFGKSESWAKLTFYRAKSKLLSLLEKEEIL